MDKTPKERIVFDEGVYYGDEGSEISIEDITSREGITVEEVLDSYTEEEIFENAMNMMDIDRSEELAGLKAFLDGSDSPLSSYDNPLGGNRIIARGSIGRWDGTRHGMTAYRDFDDMMGGHDSVFKDCEIGKVWDENGSLFIHGYHHDGGVDVEVRQLTDAGEEALDVIEDAWVGEPFTINDKEYDGSWESVNAAMRELWENPALCPSPRYMELAFGCPAVEYEAPVIDPLLETAEFTSSAIMSAEVAPGAASATVHDVAGVPYEVPADVLNGLKDAVRISDRAATTTLFTSLTIAGWTQKGDESAKASPVSLKAAAKEARESSAALAAHGASTIDLEHEVDNAQKASETFFDAMATVRKEAALWISTTRPRSCVLFRQSRTTPMYRVGPVKPSRTRCASSSRMRRNWAAGTLS